MENKVQSGNTLRQYAEKYGETLSLAANVPIQINDSADLWFVERGAVDIFSAKYDGDEMQSSLNRFVRMGSDRLIFGAEHTDNPIKLVAKGIHGTVVQRLRREQLIELLSQNQLSEGLTSELLNQLNAWIENYSAAVANDMEVRPSADHMAKPGNTVASGVVSAQQGVVWLISDDLDASYLGLIDDLIETDQTKLVPLTQDSWVQLYNSEAGPCKSSADLNLIELISSILPKFQRVSLGALALHQQLLIVDEANLQKAQTKLRHQHKLIARSKLASLTSSANRIEAHEAPLEAALRMVGEHEGIVIHTPLSSSRSDFSLSDYLKASALRAREINLSSESRWWLGDSGALIGFRRDNDQPVVLLPRTIGSYRVVDPVSGESAPANQNTAAELHHVYMLYPGLQKSDPVELAQLAPVAKVRIAGDVTRLLIFGLGGGLLALAPAVVANILVGRVVQHGDVGTLLQLSACLIAFALVAALLNILRGTAMMCLEGRAAARLGAVLMDRLLNLKPDFFRRYNAGEIAVKSLIFQDIRDHISGIAADGVLTTLFLLPAFVLMFFYDAKMAIAAFILAMLVLTVVVLFCILQIEPQRRYLEKTLEIAGEVHQFLIGITKVRLAGAEDSAFAHWASRYRELKTAEIQLSVLTEHLSAFAAAIPAFVSAVLFLVVMTHSETALAIEDFLAAYTAAMIFYMSIFLLAQSARMIATIKPACEQVESILSSSPSMGSHGNAQLNLNGEILLDRVSFSYPSQETAVLQDVSIHAKPGEFIAVVGESGSGKSTILRLALGLEVPSSGAVYYDNRDLCYLDLAMIRRQIGVVTQEGGLQSGTVLDNINGVVTDLTTDDAWRAARLAVVDEDIRAMPMQLHTSVGENSATFSGGQIQRIRIAAALARNPKIIFLDEATSWLDTKSQALTMESISESSRTRFVIAHRLSTIRTATRIYVLQAGRVAQVGGFDELFETDGFFRDMALRQMA